jgi:hypothetical protein
MILAVSEGWREAHPGGPITPAVSAGWREAAF